LVDLSSLSVMIDDDLCAFPSLHHHEGLEWTFLLEKRGKKKKLLCNKVICKVTLSFTPIPSFSGIRKVKEIRTKWRRSGKKERGDETQFTTKNWWETSLGPSYFRFVKVSFSVTHLMPYYAKTSCSRPLINCLTLQITLTLIF
jgi:hypothetical protein